jgi:hypothetical protein
MTNPTPGAQPVTAAPASPDRETFEAFFRETEPKLRHALVAAYGFEEGREADAEALAWAWERWERLRDVANRPGYLFRVAQSRRRQTTVQNHAERGLARLRARLGVNDED